MADQAVIQPRRKLLSAITLAVGLVLAGSAPATAAPTHGTGCVTCLGPQTNALWQGYTPLGGFTRHGKPLTKSLRGEVLAIDERDGYGGGAILWPLIKALDAFGTWTGVQPAPQVCLSGNFCFIPTFDLSHAVYHSRYAAFVPVFILNGAHCVRRLPTEARTLLERERWRFNRRSGERSNCWNPPLASPGTESDSPTPLLLTGGYLQVGPQVVAPADFEGPAPGGPPVPPGSSQAPLTGLPFTTVHDALASNTPTNLVPSAVLYAVNAEANIIEALICHADRMQPRATCARSVIKTLLKRIH